METAGNNNGDDEKKVSESSGNEDESRHTDEHSTTKSLTKSEDQVVQIEGKAANKSKVLSSMKIGASKEGRDEEPDDCMPPGGEEAQIEREAGLCIASDQVGEWSTHRTNRETWTGKLDFILSCIGYAVGLGNVWRFPYLCYRNGGGAFLVPYFIFLVLCGMPMIMLEICIGQFASLSPTALYQKFCPLFQGLGWGMCILSGIVCVYYNVIIAWTLYYLYQSFRGTLLWIGCDNAWNTPGCVDDIAGLRPKNQTQFNSSQGTSFIVNSSLSSMSSEDTSIVKRTSSEQFWRNKVLGLSSGIEDLGSIQWELFLSLALAWLLIFSILAKGIKSSGKVVYLTATFPYFVLIVLLIRGATLPGAADGIKFYLVPDWSKLMELSVWQDAASQIFYSVGAAWGALITMASYNKFHHNSYRDAIILPMINCATSIFAGIVVFSIIGFMAHESGESIENVITSGPGLVFIVYPEAVTHLPVSPLWSILFFLLILTIGIDSQFGMFEVIIAAVIDSYPEKLRHRKVAFTGFCCFIMFLLGIPCVTQGGVYVLQLMDWYSATFSLMFISMCECLLVSYNYGSKRFALDIKLMTHKDINGFYIWGWATFTPFCIFSLLVVSLINHAPVSYNDYVYPTSAVVIGWIIALVSAVPIPVYAAYHMLNAKGSFTERLAECVRPKPDWGPSRIADRKLFLDSLAEVPTKQTHVQGVQLQADVQGAQIVEDGAHIDMEPDNQQVFLKPDEPIT